MAIPHSENEEDNQAMIWYRKRLNRRKDEYKILEDGRVCWYHEGITRGYTFPHANWNNRHTSHDDIEKTDGAHNDVKKAFSAGKTWFN